MPTTLDCIIKAFLSFCWVKQNEDNQDQKKFISSWLGFFSFMKIKN